MKLTTPEIMTVLAPLCESFVSHNDVGEWTWRHGKHPLLMGSPSFDPVLSILDARAAEECILKTSGEWQSYVKALGLIFQRDLNAHGTWEIFCQRSEQGVCHGIIQFLRATPLQRCEAMLRVRNLWPLEIYETPDLYIKPDVRPFDK